jgi:hypothetical protein
MSNFEKINIGSCELGVVDDAPPLLHVNDEQLRTELRDLRRLVVKVCIHYRFSILVLIHLCNGQVHNRSCGSGKPDPFLALPFADGEAPEDAVSQLYYIHEFATDELY